MSRYFLGVTFFAGEHNPAQLEFRYGTTLTKEKQQGHFIVYGGVRLYGISIRELGFIGIARFPKDRLDVTRRERRKRPT